MIRQLFRDSAIYTISSFLSRGISLILLPLYTRLLSPTDYGSLDLLTILTTLVHLTVALEILQGIARFLPEAKDEQQKKTYASTALWFSIAAYGLFFVLAFAFARALSVIVLETPLREDIMRIAVVNIVVRGVLQQIQGQFRFALRPYAHLLVSLIQILVTPVATVYLLVGAGLGLEGVLFGQIVGGFAALVLAIFLSRGLHTATLNLRVLRTLLTFSIPLVPSSVGVFVATYIDRIMIRELMTIADVGVFGAAVRLSSIVALAYAGLQLAVTPIIYNRYEDPQTAHDLARIFRYVVGFSLLMWILLTVFSYEIVSVFTSEDFYGAAAALSPLVLATVLSTLYLFAPGLAVAKQTSTFALINIIGAAVNMVLNLALIPRAGIQGAATATLISSSVTFAAMMWFSQRHYHVPHRWPRLGAALGIAFLAVIVANLVGAGTWPSFLAKVGLAGLALCMFIALKVIEAPRLARTR